MYEKQLWESKDWKGPGKVCSNNVKVIPKVSYLSIGSLDSRRRGFDVVTLNTCQYSLLQLGL